MDYGRDCDRSWFRDRILQRPHAESQDRRCDSGASAVVDPNQRRIQDYRQEIAEQTRKLADEQARLEKAKKISALQSTR